MSDSVLEAMAKDTTADPVTSQATRMEGSVLPDLSHLTSLKSYLGVDTMDSKTSRQLDYIYNQLKTGPKMNEGDLLTAAKELKLRLGYPRLGETMTGKIYNYLRAMETVKNAEKIRDAYLA